MLQRSFTIFFLSTLFASTSFADHIRQPKLTPQNSNTTQGLIAVSPVDSRVVWASGRGGTFVRTTDGGKTWTSGVVPGAEALEFRDVQGFSDKHDLCQHQCVYDGKALMIKRVGLVQNDRFVKRK